MDNVIARSTGIQDLLKKSRPHALTVGISALNRFGIQQIMANEKDIKTEAEKAREYRATHDYSAETVLGFCLATLEAAGAEEDDLEVYFLKMFLALDTMSFSEGVRGFRIREWKEPNGKWSLLFRVSLGCGVTKERRQILLATYTLDTPPEEEFYTRVSQLLTNLIVEKNKHQVIHMGHLVEGLGPVPEYSVAISEFTDIAATAFKELGGIGIGTTIISFRNQKTTKHWKILRQ